MSISDADLVKDYQYKSPTYPDPEGREANKCESPSCKTPRAEHTTLYLYGRKKGLGKAAMLCEKCHERVQELKAITQP